MLYLSYGIPKSASTFSFQITKRLARCTAEQTGIPCLTLQSVFPEATAADFVPPTWDLDDAVDRLLEHTGSGTDAFAVIKLHHRCTAHVAELIESGRVLASATFRHPADVALSLMDAARIDAKRFAYYKDLDATKRTVADGVRSFESWRAASKTLAIHFDDLALRPRCIAIRMATQMRIDVDVDAALKWLLDDKSRIVEFNKGIVDRRLSELGEEEIAYFEDKHSEFCRFIEDFKRETACEC